MVSSDELIPSLGHIHFRIRRGFNVLENELIYGEVNLIAGPGPERRNLSGRSRRLVGDAGHKYVIVVKWSAFFAMLRRAADDFAANTQFAHATALRKWKAAGRFFLGEASVEYVTLAGHCAPRSLSKGEAHVAQREDRHSTVWYC